MRLLWVAQGTIYSWFAQTTKFTTEHLLQLSNSPSSMSRKPFIRTKSNGAQYLFTSQTLRYIPFQG